MHVDGLRNVEGKTPDRPDRVGGSDRPDRPERLDRAERRAAARGVDQIETGDGARLRDSVARVAAEVSRHGDEVRSRRDELLSLVDTPIAITRAARTFLSNVRGERSD